jgi:uncharacterized membrane protein
MKNPSDEQKFRDDFPRKGQTRGEVIKAMIMVQNKPYFCPNCRSNRVKFSVISSTSQRFMKDAVTGEILSVEEPQTIQEPEATVQCQVCHFIGNEMRFIKQAEREPRTAMSQPSMQPAR